MKGVYVYPVTGRNHSGASNPYVFHLIDVLSSAFEVVNAHHPSDKGILDLFKYLRKTDFIYLNWIENLPSRQLGSIQSFLFFLICGFCRLSGKRVIWTLHNKRSHSEKHTFLKGRLYNYMIRRSDLIITHSREGLDLIPQSKFKMYEPHPVANPVVYEKGSVRYDIIIWGSIARYKGIQSFLGYLEDAGKITQFRILIAGKVMEPDLAHTLEQYVSRYENLSLMNRFIPSEELASLILQSSVVLFSYHPESVLSSGALMDSLSFPCIILGPRSGAFADLEDEGLILTYSDYRDLVSRLEQMKAAGFGDPGNLDRRKQFLDAHTWQKFGETIRNAMLSWD